ncbi:MAG: hypothetical protein ACREPR_11020 [Brasilonema sp.]
MGNLNIWDAPDKSCDRAGILLNSLLSQLLVSCNLLYSEETLLREGVREISTQSFPQA